VTHGVERLPEPAASDIIAGMRRFPAVLLAAAALLGAYACGTRTPSRDLPATFVWGKDQSSIDPASGRMNVWGGFSVGDGAFSAEKNMSRFILWRTADSDARIAIQYVLQGKPCRFLVNGTAAGKLDPSPRPASATFPARLNAGFNFLEFDKTTNDVLRIRSVLVDPRDGRPRRPRCRPPQSAGVFSFGPMLSPHRPGRGGSRRIDQDR